MPENTSNIIQLLRRWLSGEIRATEEQQLDRGAEEDPFLRDALDGYRQHPEADHEAAMNRIRGKLQERSRRGGGGYVRRLPRVAAAAAMLLLIGAVLWLINLPGGGDGAALSERDMRRPRQMEQIEPKETVAEEAETATGAELQTEPLPPPEAETAREEKQVTTAAPPPKPEARREEALALDSPPAADIAAAEPAPALDSFSEAAGLTAPAAARQALRESPQEDSLAQARQLVGLITTSSDDPVTGAQIQLPGADFGTVTDSSGQFQLEAPAWQEQLVIYRPGYADAVITVEQGQALNITLEEGERAATRERAAKRLAPPQPLTEGTQAFVWPPPQPEGGFDALEKYVDTHRQYPEAATHGLEGTVHLQFTVEPGGELSNFKVLESPGDPLSREAIRLLQNGPAWELPEGRSTPMLATYRVGFNR